MHTHPEKKSWDIGRYRLPFGRTMVLVILSSVLPLTGLLSAGESVLVEPVGRSEFMDIRQLCSVAADDLPWRTIRWTSDLWQARQQAADLGKPILLWHMDGHPLGCT